ncbi:DNA polymerase Y family protein [Ponticaulis sp.]|uniref:Y-family DNA polymerase n=1 Tax=Ponticaulis sp. TaxID=2020902 RepID=UPI000B637F07|nr:DNA polymerase Y family protein [Ponticaulis sp.]MAI91684.1 nucleotidyltransferase [Ponticaulis sp.]OUX96947.1 MAG: hypothetical protein CBB65_14685 [Hyphomonadaceae bacterium TMED5]|tara:strand:+ start:13103 stop:14590 length:1488 start_codon:yes stop_codon:yes gene_type:complete
MRRVLCLWLPQLPLERLARKGDLRLEGPFAIIAEQKSAWRVTHMNAQALRAGVGPGQSLPDARAICPELLSEPADPVREKALLYALRRWADTLSPSVALFEPDMLLLDIAGVDHLFGGEDAMAAHAVERLSDIGFSVATGIADTQSAARALARFAAPGQTIAPPGSMRAVLSAMPLEALDCPDARRTELRRTGFRTIGELAEIKQADLARRYGIEVVNGLAALLGYRPDPVAPSMLEPSYAARMSLPEPIGLLSDLEEVLRRLAGQVCQRLQEKGMGARSFSLTVRCVDTGDHHLKVGFAKPCNAPEQIIQQFVHPLDKLKIEFGADWFRLWAEQVEPVRSRQMVLDHAGAETDATSQLLSSLGNRLGFDRIERFVPHASHLPGRTYARVEASRHEASENWKLPGRGRPLHLFAAPRAITVTQAGRPPSEFVWQRRAYHSQSIEGPERYTPEWWQDADLRTRDYWAVQTEEGPRFWLLTYPGVKPAQWYLAGRFA